MGYEEDALKFVLLVNGATEDALRFVLFAALANGRLNLPQLLEYLARAKALKDKAL